MIGDADPAGVKVLSVIEGGPASQAGFRENDIITSIDEKAIKSLDDMTAVIAARNAGDRLRFAVVRADRSIELEVELGEAAPSAAAPTASTPPAAGGRPRLGIHVATVTDELRAQYGVGFPSGALVTAVQAGSPADRAGLPAGAVVFSIDGQPVERQEDVVNRIASASWGQTIALEYTYNGSRLRKEVRLPTAEENAISAAASAARPRTAQRVWTLRPPLFPPGVVIPDRPTLERIERMIREFAGPYRFAEEPPPTNAGNESAGEQEEVDRLRGEVDRLRQRVRELESSPSRATP